MQVNGVLKTIDFGETESDVLPVFFSVVSHIEIKVQLRVKIDDGVRLVHFESQDLTLREYDCVLDSWPCWVEREAVDCISLRSKLSDDIVNKSPWVVLVGRLHLHLWQKVVLVSLEQRLHVQLSDIKEFSRCFDHHRIVASKDTLLDILAQLVKLLVAPQAQACLYAPPVTLAEQWALQKWPIMLYYNDASRVVS